MPYRLQLPCYWIAVVAAIDTIRRGSKSIADLIAIGGTIDYVVPILIDKILNY